MHKYLSSLFVLLLLFSCKKEEQVPRLDYLPKMKVKEFDAEVSIEKPYLSLDVDGNFFGDVYYQVYAIEDMTLPGYRYKFYGSGNKMVSFPISGYNEFQDTKVLKKGDIIDASSFSGPYVWTNYPFVLMATKNIPYFNQPSSWEGGHWKNVSRVYQGFFLEYPFGRFYGWVELTMDAATEKLTIHASAISTEPDKGVMAGYR